MVARIAAEPINTNVAVSEFRTRMAGADLQAGAALPQDDPLPPILTPVPTPVPTPAVVTPSQAFAAALIAERLPARQPDAAELRLRQSSDWQVPDSSLRLTDRQA